MLCLLIVRLRSLCYLKQCYFGLDFVFSFFFFQAEDGIRDIGVTGVQTCALPISDTIRRTYRHLVVDEYQDVSPLQEALLTLWRGDRTDLCVVGDPAQTIHSFAGAQAHFLTDFARRHRGARVIKLVRDYRSTPQVVGCANKIMAGVKAGGVSGVTLQAQQPPGPEVENVEAPDEAAEAGGIADWLVTRAQAGVQWRDMAVLFRINAQSPAIEQALADRQVPYLVRGGERFYERPEVRQALLTLRTQARSMGGDEAGSAVEQMKAVLGTLGWTSTPPDGAGAVRERREPLDALLAVAEDLTAERGDASALDLRAGPAELEQRKR